MQGKQDQPERQKHLDWRNLENGEGKKAIYSSFCTSQIQRGLHRLIRLGESHRQLSRPDFDTMDSELTFRDLHYFTFGGTVTKYLTLPYTPQSRKVLGLIPTWRRLHP